MPNRSLREAKVRAAFLDNYRVTGVIVQAARAAGVSVNHVAAYRRRAPAFGAEVLAARQALAAPRPLRRVRVTAERKRIFFDALSETGNARRAALAAGLGYHTVWHLRMHDASFAAAWAAAKNQALDGIEDRLFDAVLNGFTKTDTVNGVTRTTVAQNAAAMFKLLARRAKDGHRYKTIELTPRLVAAAQERVRRRIREEAAEQAAEIAATRALPPPTVTADPAGPDADQ